MASKLIFGPATRATVEGINVPRMREERAAKAKQVMKQQGIPAMLVTGEPNVRYLTGFSWEEFQPFLSYVLFFAEHDPVVFAHAGSYQQVPDQVPWIKNWRIARATLQHICGAEAAREEMKLLAQEVRQELLERGLASEKLGVVGFEDMTKEALKSARLKLVDGWPLLLEASKTKTIDEINCMKIVASIGTSGWQRLMATLRPGVTVGRVGHEVMNALSEAGADRAICGILSGPMSFERNLSTVNRRVEYGDLLYAPLCGTSYMGYTACLYRSFKAGQKPTDKEKDWYKQVRERLDRAIEATKIGNTTADAAKAYPPASKWGYKDEAEVLSVEVGHGIGLVSLAPSAVHYNLPVINRQWSLKHPQPFEKGMIIAYESLEGEHRVGGVRLEDMVVVTENGAEILDYFPRDEIITVG